LRVASYSSIGCAAISAQSELKVPMLATMTRDACIGCCADVHDEEVAVGVFEEDVAEGHERNGSKHW
jgi:hypothetical protein